MGIGESLDTALDQAQLNWAPCSAILDLVQATGRPLALQQVLGRNVDLVAVLDDEGEMDLLVAVIERYFPDEGHPELV